MLLVSLSLRSINLKPFPYFTEGNNGLVAGYDLQNEWLSIEIPCGVSIVSTLKLTVGLKVLT